MKEGRIFEVTLVSANNLPNVRSYGQMRVYAEISLNEKSKTIQKTPVDRDGELNPTWNYCASYKVTETAVQEPGLNVVVKLFCERSMGDKFIGKVSIPVMSLFNAGHEAEKTLDVDGTPNGVLNVRYRFGERILFPKETDWTKVVVKAGVVALIHGVVMGIVGT